MSIFLPWFLLLFWNVSQIVCQRQCPFREATWGRFIHPCSNFVGQSCIYSCYSDFNPPNFTVTSSINVTCTPQGYWSGNLDCPVPIAQSVVQQLPQTAASGPSFPTESRVCPDILNLPNRLIRGVCSKAKDGDVCYFECQKGFALNGSTEIVCRQGSWSQSCPTCLPDQTSSAACPALTTPGNGTFTPECSASRIGSQCNLMCNLGYKAVGTNPFTCTEKGWTNENPRCIDIVCPAITQLKNGYLVGDCDPGFAGNFCAFACKKDFALVGPSVSICSYAGSWDPPDSRYCIPLSACNVGVSTNEVLPGQRLPNSQAEKAQPSTDTRFANITTQTQTVNEEIERDEAQTRWEFVGAASTIYPEGKEDLKKRSLVRGRRKRSF